VFNSFGSIFKITSFGESHGKIVGVVVDGVPPGIYIDTVTVQQWLDRRKPGNFLHSTRREADMLHVGSGLDTNSITLGSPIVAWVCNEDAKSADYHNLQSVFRPSHADFTYAHKYGTDNQPGGGRSSARETVARVIGGSIAYQILRHFVPLFQIHTWVWSLGNLSMPIENFWFSFQTPPWNHDYKYAAIPCPHAETQTAMEAYLKTLKDQQDSIESSVGIYAWNLPIGLGSPVFEKLSAKLAQGFFSIPACKSLSFDWPTLSAYTVYGSIRNDIQTDTGFVTNYSSGIQGGISNGEPIYAKIGFKPPSSIAKTQVMLTHTKNSHKPRDPKNQSVQIKGRHDPSLAPRACVVVESMACIVFLDSYLQAKSQPV
jgi:chorismate synthase